MAHLVLHAVVIQSVVITLFLCGLVRSYVISDVWGHGRVFDGIGAISGGSVST